MNNGFNVFRQTLAADTVTEIAFGLPAYEAIVKNFSTSSCYVFSGSKAADFDVDSCIKIEPNMGQLIFINNINNGNEDNFDRLYLKTQDGGEVEIQVIGF